MTTGTGKLPFLLLCLGSNKCAEVGGEVASKEGLLWRDVEKHGQRFRVKARLQNLMSKNEQAYVCNFGNYNLFSLILLL